MAGRRIGAHLTMPHVREPDKERRDPAEMNYDPRHDSLMSDPDLREAFTRYEEEGYDYDESYYLARKEIEGEDWEPENPEYYEEETLEKFGYSDRERISRDPEDDERESSETESENPTQVSLDDMIDDS